VEFFDKHDWRRGVSAVYPIKGFHTWAVFYWTMSLFLYVAALVPLTRAPWRLQEMLGLGSGLIIALGLFMLRSRSLRKASACDLVGVARVMRPPPV
jgi:hypothetical protein